MMARSVCPTCGRPETVKEQNARLAREHREAAKGFEAAHRSYEWHMNLAKRYEERS